MAQALQPASKILALFESNRALARILDVNPSALTRWKKPRSQGGTGGRIPQKYWGQIIDAAADRGIDVTVEDLADVLR